eukprot:TRINITY_DN4779_c1_g1_i1.p1 TRINITY_DN4779_c1_g1~~TRINITY_DN4779_c1_g1_i1.p1  ORF type:complete len:590 (-),score=157.13 TRINITY_DN4779_c1_g1_i1:388-2157(-)
MEDSDPLLSPFAFEGESRSKKKPNSMVSAALAIFFVCLIIIGLVVVGASGELPEEPVICSLYCEGDLLNQIQMAQLEPDSKTFVDKPLLVDPDVAQTRFKALPDHEKATLEKFVNENFGKEGSDLETVEMTDWIESPKLLARIGNDKFRAWATGLNDIWKELARKPVDCLKDNPDRHSLLWTPHLFVVPGGRFRESYYWDTYWIIQGLLLTENYDTVKGMIRNFIHFIHLYGFVPNGGRQYYLKRTQPPLLSNMVMAYYEKTKDLHFVREALPTLEKEYKHWMKKGEHTVYFDGPNGTQYVLNRYFTSAARPRPESYYEDVELTKSLTGTTRDKLLQNLGSAAESGWDFSTRWMIDGSTKLSDLKTLDIVPVDLNVFMLQFEMNMEKLHGLSMNVRDNNRKRYFKHIAAKRREAINSILWDKDHNMWFDYDTETTKLRTDVITPACFMPLLVGLVGTGSSEEKILTAFENSGLLKVAGVTTSLNESGQQWDMPNAWPPLQQLLEEAFRVHGGDKGKELARSLAHRWLQTNLKAWSATTEHWMYEKYDSTQMGKGGGGGEYKPQKGFGWSNGVALMFLNQYANDLPEPLS